MRLKVYALTPCVTFFATGRFGMGAVAMLMQGSLFLWPTALRMAREYSETHAVDGMLTTLSETYQVPAPPLPPKRFAPEPGLAAQTVAAPGRSQAA